MALILGRNAESRAALDSLSKDRELQRMVADMSGTWTVAHEPERSALLRQFVDDRPVAETRAILKEDRVLRLISANWNPDVTEVFLGDFGTKFTDAARTKLRQKFDDDLIQDNKRKLGLWLGVVDPSWKRFGSHKESRAKDGKTTISHKKSRDGSSGGWEFLVGADGHLISARAEMDGDTVHLYEYADWGTRMGWDVPGTVIYKLHDKDSGEVIFTETRRLEALEPLPDGFDWDPWRLHVAANPELEGRTEPE